MRTRERRDGQKMIFVCLAMAIGLALVVGPTLVQGQEKGFPTKPIEVVVPYAPGGVIDIATRIIVEPLSRELKVPVVIRNRKGAGGLIVTTAFSQARPDGYTMLTTSPSAVISTVQQSKTPAFDPRKDFAPVAHIGISPVSMVVAKDSPFKTFDDFVQFGKANPGKLRAGFSSPGGETHAMVLSIISGAKIESKVIPYTSSGETTAALLGGHVDWATASLVSRVPYLKSGDMRCLLVTQRSPEAPGVPSGPDVGLPSVSVNIWVGAFVHSKAPKAAHERLVSAVKAVLDAPEMRDKLTKAGLMVDYKGPQEFSQIVNKDWDVFSEALEAAGMKAK